LDEVRSFVFYSCALRVEFALLGIFFVICTL
jgi:hypothetical protein